ARLPGVETSDGHQPGGLECSQPVGLIDPLVRSGFDSMPAQVVVEIPESYKSNPEGGGGRVIDRMGPCLKWLCRQEERQSGREHSGRLAGERAKVNVDAVGGAVYQCAEQ